MNITATWKPGFSTLYKANAQLVASEIATIGESATPAQIVDKARDPASELHKCFEWDDSKAAESYRIQQARQVVRHLVIRETVREDKPPIRFFFAPKGGGGYQTTKIIVRNQDAYQSLLASALRDFGALRVKYHSLVELEQIFDELDNLISSKSF